MFHHFNPRAPVWGDLTARQYLPKLAFQSTRPVWGDQRPAVAPVAQDISIHAPPYGATAVGKSPFSVNFNPRAPYGATAKLHNFPVQFCAKVTINTMPQTICRQNMPAASFKLQEAYPYFRCEAPGKKLSACASHSDHQHTLRLIAGLDRSALSASDTYRRDSKTANCPARHQ